MKFNLYFFLLICSISLYSKTIQVNPTGQYSNIQSAAAIALPGDSILVDAAIYSGGMFINNLKGEHNKYITLIGDSTKETIIRGGTNAIQLTDPNYLIIKNLIFEQQTGNGLNLDDGGTIATPAHHIKIENCIFRNINATGNNDLLKLSGIDTFEVNNCKFENGAAGGSGIDMVGCHNGQFIGNRFKNQGSNAIQAKGGSQYILIQRNYFENCGQRTLNLGGSTGLEYFRPIDAKFEAADIAVYSNIIIGSIAPIAYVGSIRVDVTNNTIIRPEKWVIRILQETVDTTRFFPCSMGKFQNNLIYMGNLSICVNVGPNTKSEQFSYKNNFWYNFENSSWTGPNTSTPDITKIIGIDPQFENPLSDFRLKTGSKAIGLISFNAEPTIDFFGNKYKTKRSAGAIESGIISDIESDNTLESSIFPNPASDFIEISLSPAGGGRGWTELVEVGWKVEIHNVFGEKIPPRQDLSPALSEVERTKIKIDISNLPAGVYFIKIGDRYEKFIKL